MAWEIAKGILIAVAILAALALILPSLLNALLPLLQRSRRSVLSWNQRRAIRAAEPHVPIPGRAKKVVYGIAWFVFLANAAALLFGHEDGNIGPLVLTLVFLAITCFVGAAWIVWMWKDK